MNDYPYNRFQAYYTPSPVLPSPPPGELESPSYDGQPSSSPLQMIMSWNLLIRYLMYKRHYRFNGPPLQADRSFLKEVFNSGSWRRNRLSDRRCFPFRGERFRKWRSATEDHRWCPCS